MHMNNVILKAAVPKHSSKFKLAFCAKQYDYYVNTTVGDHIAKYE